jgi:hypothetical protein
VPLDTRSAGYVGKGPITVISEKIVVRRVLDLRRMKKIVDRGSVNDIKIYVAVVVVIKPDATTAVDLQNPVFFPASAGQFGPNPGVRCDISKEPRT